MRIDPAYHIDADSAQFLRTFAEPREALILEVGANQEHSANVLTDNGYKVLGIDLLSHTAPPLPNYHRLIGDFCVLAAAGILPQFDAIYSTSAIEHFGLGTYGNADLARDPDYDSRAMHFMWKLLKPGGHCYITVPYSKRFFTNGRDWRCYDRAALQERIIQDFTELCRYYFKSDWAAVPDAGVDRRPPCPLPVQLVHEADADAYYGDPPHVTVLLRMKKGQTG